VIDEERSPALRRYAEEDADNVRWDGFEFRPGDIVIAAPSKSGTTWTQLLVALLVFDGPEFPEPVGKMSLWMDQKTRSVEAAHAIFSAQQHRRFIKTHTPLDGVPVHDEVRYVCVGRDPRDAIVSMLHHSDNLDRARLGELIGTEFTGPEGTHTDRIDRWLDGGSFPDWSARSLLEQYLTFWDRRHLPHVELFHFADYLFDLPGEVIRLADHLGIEITPERATELAAEAAIDRARERADEVVPEAHLGVFKDTAGFLRGGRAGDGIAEMTREQLERYDQLVAEVVPDPELVDWIHRGRAS
jgi:hypothetical protein